MKRILFFFFLFSLFLLGEDLNNFYSKLTLDTLEMNDKHDKKLEGNFWIGNELDKLYIYSKEHRTDEGEKHSIYELLYSKAVAPYWDIQIGGARERNNDHYKNWVEISFMGTAPYFIDTRASFLFGKDGNIAFLLDAEKEFPITQFLFVIPRAELNIFSKDDSDMGFKKGLSEFEASIRLKYEIEREFAPYIGFSYNKDFYNDSQENNFIFGISIWF